MTADKKEGSKGNRYYTADTITRIRTIRILQNMGLSLNEIYDYYNGTANIEPVITRMERLRNELDFNIEKLKERQKKGNNFEIHTITIPEQTVYCQTRQAYSVEEKKEHLREIIVAAMKLYGSDTSKHMFFNQSSLKEPELTSYCISVPPGSKGEYVVDIPEEKALCIMYHGSYETLEIPRDKIIAYAKEHHVSLKGIYRNIFLEGPVQHKDPDKFITQVALLIE